jgi:hypothetical protein
MMGTSKEYPNCSNNSISWCYKCTDFVDSFSATQRNKNDYNLLQVGLSWAALRIINFFLSLSVLHSWNSCKSTQILELHNSIVQWKKRENNMSTKLYAWIKVTPSSINHNWVDAS